MTGFRYKELPIFIWPILWFVQKVFFGDFVGSFFFNNFKTRQNVESILKEQGVYVDKTHVDDELLEILLGPSEDEGAKDVFLRVFRGPPGPSPENLLQELESPVLAIWGKSDPWTVSQEALFLYNVRPWSPFANTSNNRFCSHCTAT